ncbi:985_t:CDS:2, partial [Funneliformis mosseae]
LRKIIIKIRSSSQQHEKLSNTCKNNQINDLKPILDVSTRWKLTYNMIQRALILRNALEPIILSDCELKKDILTDEDWNNLK